MNDLFRGRYQTMASPQKRSRCYTMCAIVIHLAAKLTNLAQMITAEFDDTDWMASISEKNVDLWSETTIYSCDLHHYITKGPYLAFGCFGCIEYGASMCEYCQQNFRKFSVIDHDYIILCHVLVHIKKMSKLIRFEACRIARMWLLSHEMHI